MFSSYSKTPGGRFPDSAEEALELSLSDLDDAFLTATCCHSVQAGVAWFRSKCGDQKLATFVGRLTCRKCGSKPKEVSIQDGPYYRPGVGCSARLWLVGSDEGEGR